MKFGPKRAHVMFIFENFIKDFGLFLIALVAFIFIRDINILLDNLAIVVIALLGPVSRLIRFVFTKYTINDECLLVESGWLKKMKQEIPLATISSVDVTQNLIFQLTKVYVLHVENAGSIGNADNGSVKLILGNDDATLVKGMLLAGKTAPQQETAVPESEVCDFRTVTASAGEVLTMCVFQIRWIVVGLQMIAYVAIIMSFADDYIFNKGPSGTAMIVDYAMGAATVLIAGLIVGLYLVSLIISTITSFLKYYNFRVTDRGDSIHVEYGLFTRKSHTLMKEKISGIKYTQSMLMRMMKSGTLQIFVAGYGGMDDGNEEETVLLYPAIKEGNIHGFVSSFLPEQVEAPEYERAPGKGLPYFFICARFIMALILCAALISATCILDLPWEAAALGMVILLLAAVSVVMEYMHSAVAYNGENITISNGGFRKTTVILRSGKVEYVEDYAGEMKRRRKQLVTIKVGVLAPAALSEHKVRNINTEVFENIKGKLIY